MNAEAPDGVIEGIEAVGDSFVLGVQWHPEFLNPNDQSEILFKAFLKRAAQHRKTSRQR